MAMEATTTLSADLDRRLAGLWRVIGRGGYADLSRTATSVLATLRDAGPHRITALAGAEGVAQPTMTNLVGRLERRGLVERTTDPHDARAVLVAIAPGDRTMEPARTRAAFGTAPSRTKRFVSTPGGHGWGMLNDGTDAEPSWTPLATTVLRWVRGEHA